MLLGSNFMALFSLGDGAHTFELIDWTDRNQTGLLLQFIMVF